AGWSDNSASKPEDSDKPQAKQEVKEEATETAKDAEQPSSSETTSNEAPEKKDSE
ncbi:hypothetical protein HKB30_27110, partial [Vibrio parahaemolyticus]|nr:hypothetical protein [Vibrio parahaemolyticus]